MRFVDLFAGLGGFRLALEQLGHECVFASEIDGELQELYNQNFPGGPAIHGDIRRSKGNIPPHDILCAGFPCQPFSKSGAQAGIKDVTTGTLFHEILETLALHKPTYVILENVGNFERHDEGRTWHIVKTSLETLGYEVKGTQHIASGGQGLLSPHHLGFPHHRERFFAVASLDGLPEQPFPQRDRRTPTSMKDIVQQREELSASDCHETQMTEQHRRCIDHWNELLAALPDNRVVLPSFPIWGDEVDAIYPFENTTPWAELTIAMADPIQSDNGATSSAEAFATLPSYARTQKMEFPDWKIRFIKLNRDWFKSIQNHLPPRWRDNLRYFPPTLRKLEWNCQGEKRDLWAHMLQFRPSGLRAKRYASSPSLVAMTSTQIPILGPEKRHLTRVEGLRLQGFNDNFNLPFSRTATFKALGNAVHVHVVYTIARTLLPVEPPSA